MDKTSLCRSFLQAAKNQKWWNNGSVALAVSGGSDSMALLWFFLNCGGSPRAVFHLDHSLRAASCSEALFVQRRCQELHVPWIGKKIDVPALRRKGESMEEACRRLRYSFFSEAAKQHQIRWVATGHTMDDQAETVLMHLCRGTGLYGLAGIPPVRDCWVRPLLSFRRQELRDLLTSVNWPWVEDESNDQLDYLRNRVRHHVVPVMTELVNSRTVEHLAALANEAWQRRLVEEKRQTELLQSLQCQNIWPWRGFQLKELRSLDDETLLLVLRGQARRLRWASLSRLRWKELTELIRRSGRFRFQWDNCHDLFCAQGLLWWGPSTERYELKQTATAKRWGGWSLHSSSHTEYPWSLRLPTKNLQEVILQPVEKGISWIEEQLPALWFRKKLYARPSNQGWEIVADGVQYESYGNTLTFSPLEALQEDPAWTIE